jgi:hypothetical protein
MVCSFAWTRLNYAEQLQRSEAGIYVIRIRGAVHQKTKTVDEAVCMLKYTADRGAVETLPAE